MLDVSEVLPGVVRAVPEVRVEAVFDDGTRLAVVRDPFRARRRLPGRPEVYRSCPGPMVEVEVTNTAAVPISVTSHFHFFEANPRLRFDRAAAYGMHLAVDRGRGGAVRAGRHPAGRRWSRIGGRRVVIGFAGLVDGPLDAPGARERALEKARACGYLETGAP